MSRHILLNPLEDLRGTESDVNKLALLVSPRVVTGFFTFQETPIPNENLEVLVTFLTRCPDQLLGSFTLFPPPMFI